MGELTLSSVAPVSKSSAFIDEAAHFASPQNREGRPQAVASPAFPRLQFVTKVQDLPRRAAPRQLPPLFHHNEMGAAVLLPARLTVLGAKWTFLAPAHRIDAIRSDAERD